MTAVWRRRVSIDGVPIAFQVAGHGRPIVLVHGLSGSGRWWTRNIAALAERFQVYVVDLIGFGDSRGPRRFVLGEAADYLVRWLDMLALDQATIVGHSMGGYIAADLAADHADRVERLVLVDAAVLPLRGGVVVGAGSLLGAIACLPVGFLPILVTDALRSGPLTLWRAGRELLGAELSTKLPRIDSPSLVVWGEHDRLVPLDHGYRLRDLLPRGELVIVRGAGHNPMWERPRTFNAAVLDFLDRRTTATRAKECCFAADARRDEQSRRDRAADDPPLVV